MHAATVVADHAAERAAGVGGGVGRVGEVMDLGCFAQAVENDARLNHGKLCAHIDGGEPVHVLREVEDNGDVRALSGEAGAGAAWQHGGPGGAAGGQCSFNVGRIAGHDYADGKLAVVGRVGRVHGAEAHVEADFAAHCGFEPFFEFAMGREALVFEPRLVGKDRKSAHAGILPLRNPEFCDTRVRSDFQERMVLSIRRVVPTHAATAKSVPGAAVSTGSRVSQSTSSA